jgi:hypothetical protein
MSRGKAADFLEKGGDLATLVISFLPVLLADPDEF